MARSNRTRYTILGTLTLGPRSGYDIKKFIEGSIANFWRESYGQIYPTLRELESAGLVARTAEKQEGKPDRYVYRITAEGREELREWLLVPAVSEVPRAELLLKLFFGSEVSVDASLRQIRWRRDELQKNVERLRGIERRVQEEQGDAPGYPYWRLTIRQGMLVDEALLEWCREAEKTLKPISSRPQQRRGALTRKT